ncbi:MAG: TM7S3/TM198-like domain-containing protein [bacterium]
MEFNEHTFVALLATLIGLLVCLLGYRLLRFTLGVVGLALGAYLGKVVALSLHLAGPVSLILMIALGVLGALLISLVFELAIFIFGAVSAVLIVRNLLFPTAGNNLLILGPVGILGGILALLIRRPVLSLFTALLGSLVAVTGIFSLLKLTRIFLPDCSNLPLRALSWVGLGTIGFLVQILPASRKTNNRNRRE